MKKPFALPVLCACALAGCATMAGDTDQAVALITTCEGSTAVIHAECTLSNDRGSHSVTTPATVSVSRSAGNLTVSCIAPHAEGKAVLSSSGTWSTAGNLVLGGIIGVGVDLASGAAFSYDKTLTLPMQCDTAKRSMQAN